MLDVPIRVLGTIHLHELTGEAVLLRGVVAQRLLGMLVAVRGGTVETDTLVENVWRDDPPRDAATSLRMAVSRLRARLRSVGITDAIAAGTRPSPRGRWNRIPVRSE